MYNICFCTGAIAAVSAQHPVSVYYISILSHQMSEALMLKSDECIFQQAWCRDWLTNVLFEYAFYLKLAKTQAVILPSFKLTTKYLAKYLDILSFMTLIFNRQQTPRFQNTQQQANTTLTGKMVAGQEGYIWAQSKPIGGWEAMRHRWDRTRHKW